MSTVILRHPSLPEGQEIEVDAAALPHYTGAGWQQVPAEELQKRAELKAQAETEARAAEEKAAGETEAADQPEQPEPADTPTERPARSRRAHEKKAEEN